MIARGPRDIVIKKQKPSGFFGTNLASYLTLLGCDSAIVVGTTTSGWVRATVVDAFSLNYRMIVAVADVVPLAEVLSYVDRPPAGLFDLPIGSPGVPIKRPNNAQGAATLRRPLLQRG